MNRSLHNSYRFSACHSTVIHLDQLVRKGVQLVGIIVLEYSEYQVLVLVLCISLVLSSLSSHISLIQARGESMHTRTGHKRGTGIIEGIVYRSQRLSQSPHVHNRNPPPIDGYAYSNAIGNASKQPFGSGQHVLVLTSLSTVD